MFQEKNYLNLILDSLKKNSSKTLVEDQLTQENYTYQEIHQKSLEFLKFLQKKNLNFKDKIIIKIDNSTNYLVAMLASFIGGYTLCPIDSQLPKNKFLKLKKILKPKYIIDSPKKVIFIKKGDVKVNQKNLISLILFTSGTTGEPKGIQLKLSSYLRLAKSFGELMEYKDETKIYHTLPMHYNAGLLNTFLAGLMHGSTIILGPKINSINILNLCNNLINKNINSIHITPEIANALCKINLSLDEKKSIQNIYKIVCTGSFLYDQIRKNFEKKFKKQLLSCYGLTELGGPISLQKWEDTFKENSVGEILNEVKIKNIKVKGINHIFVKTPYLFSGYIVGENKVSKPKLKNGYFDTSDIGIVKKKHLFITGRRKDIFKKGSEIISSIELENICKTNKNVSDCCIIIKEDLSKGSKIFFLIQFNNTDLDKNIKNLYNFLGKKLRKIEIPDRIIPVPKILKTSSGKTKVYEMEKIYL